MRRPAPVRELATNVQPSLRVDGTKVWSLIQLERQLRPNAFGEPLGGHPAIERGISGMHPQQYRRRTRYRSPAGWYRRINRSLGVLLTSLGLAPGDAVTLEVPGRRLGNPRRTPVLRTLFRGQDYLVALAGESDWVRNVRAADGRVVLRRRGRRQVRLVELPLDQRPAVLAAYLRRGAERGGATAAAAQARAYFGVRPNPTLEDLAAIAEYYQVFRVAYLGSGRPGMVAGSAYGASRNGGSGW